MARAGAVSLAIIALSCFGCFAPSAAVSPVQKVLSMIDDFAAKCKKDLDMAAADFAEAAKFCDTEAVERSHAIEGTKGEIEGIAAAIEDAKAKITEYEANIQTASSGISSTEGEVHDATAARKKQHETFLASEKSLLATLEELNGAAGVLEKQGINLAQLTPKAQKGLDAVVATLTAVTEASFVSNGERKKVAAFLQAKADAEDEFALKSASKGIQEVVGGLIERAEGTLATTRKKEADASHEFMMLKQSLELQIKSTQEELAENTKIKAVTTEQLAQSEKDLAVAQKALSADSAYLADFKRDCQDQARAWEAESKDGEAELTALAAAKDILVKKFSASLVQSKATLARATKSAVDVEGDDAKARALRVIEKLGHKFHSTALVSLAYQAAADPFGKVRGMIEGMIEKLMKEAAEQASQKAFCDEETSKSMASKAEKEEKLETTNARIDKAEASVAMLTEQAATLATEIAEIDTAVKEATELRTKEKTTFAAAEQNYKESEEACASAIEVLRSYYDGVSLAQTAGKAGNSGIIGMLEVAESDFAKLLADVRTEETAAADEYAKMIQDNKIAKATKEAEKKGKESEVKSLKSMLADSTSDKESLDAELDAVLSYLAELKPQCETKAPSYAEIKLKREQEIDGLKEALTILEETSFVQRSTRNLRRSSA